MQTEREMEVRFYLCALLAAKREKNHMFVVVTQNTTFSLRAGHFPLSMPIV